MENNMIIVKRFTGAWCAPCRMLAPMLNQLAQELPDVKFETVDIDENPEAVEEYGIRSVPTVLIIKDGEVKDTIVGANPKKTYLTAIQAA